MSEAPLPAGEEGHRFPGLDVLSQRDHWDDATARLIAARVSDGPEPRFFAEGEFDTASALISQLVDQEEGFSAGLCRTVDARLADTQTDGWHYDDMPRDGEVWHRGLAGLDDDARSRFGRAFRELARDERDAVLTGIRERGDGDWHGLRAGRLWDLWMRYACTACYAHPSVWNEIGFSGPAYPRGYKNAGINAREPFEVADARPRHDPIRQDAP